MIMDGVDDKKKNLNVADWATRTRLILEEVENELNNSDVAKMYEKSQNRGYNDGNASRNVFGTLSEAEELPPANLEESVASLLDEVLPEKFLKKNLEYVPDATSNLVVAATEPNGGGPNADEMYSAVKEPPHATMPLRNHDVVHEAEQLAMQLLEESKNKGRAKAGVLTSELAEKNLARAQEELGELTAAIAHLRSQRAKDAADFQDTIERMENEALSRMQEIEEAQSQCISLEAELKGTKEALTRALRDKGAMTWRLREAESEVEANRKLLNLNSARIVDNTTGETRAMVVERTKAEMRQHWARVRHIWEEEFQEKLRSSEAEAEERVRSEMTEVIEHLREQLSSKVIELSNTTKAIEMEELQEEEDNDEEQSELELEPPDTPPRSGAQQPPASPQQTVQETVTVMETRIVDPEEVEDLQEAVVAREIALMRTKMANGVHQLARFWLTHRQRHLGRALRRWAAAAAGAHFATVTELAVAHHVRMAGAANLYVTLQRQVLAWGLGYPFRRWRENILNHAGAQSVLSLHRISHIAERLKRNGVMRAFLCWKCLSDNKAEFETLHDEIKKLHQELSDIKSQTWNLKRKLLKESMNP